MVGEYGGHQNGILSPDAEQLEVRKRSCTPTYHQPRRVRVYLHIDWFVIRSLPYLGMQYLYWGYNPDCRHLHL